MIDKEAFEREYEEKYRLAQEAANGDFLEFLKNLGRNPKTDLAGYDLPSYDFSGGDLENANLRKMNLSSAKFRKTKLGGADLSYSDISGADFTDADLTGTDFHQTSAENAIFCNNVGLYERTKLDLLEQGAIFKKKSKLESLYEILVTRINTESIFRKKTQPGSMKHTINSHQQKSNPPRVLVLPVLIDRIQAL